MDLLQHRESPTTDCDAHKRSVARPDSAGALPHTWRTQEQVTDPVGRRMSPTLFSAIVKDGSL